MCMKKRMLMLISLVVGLGLINTASADLIAHWPLTGDYKDATGNGHDGTPLGNPQFVQDDVQGRVMEVDGNARVMVEDAPDLNFSANDSLTMTAWALYDPALASSGWRCIVGKGRTAPGGDNSYLDTMYAFFVSPDNEWASNMGSLGGGVGPAVPNEWHHFAFVQDGTNNLNFYYINLEELQSGGAANCATPGRPFFIGAAGNDTSAFEAFGGRVSDVRIYNEALTGDALTATTLPLSPAALARDPQPVEEATDVPHDVVLSWTPGKYAPTVNGHRVFLSDSFADVNDGVASADQGVTSVPAFDVSQLPAALAFGQTYYWRVDEANTVTGWDQGDIWRFTVEPFSYPVQPTAATASSAHANNTGPEKTIDGSGLNAQGQHSTHAADMWLSAPGANPWIQYEFDRAYKLHEMWVWNSNQLIESFIGFGAKDVLVETSIDGVEWTVLEGAVRFNQAPGLDNYMANTLVDFSGAMAKYVRLTIHAAWGAMPQYGLSEVRFFYIPTHAREPQPDDGATVTETHVRLDWRPGRGAVSHQVNLGTDPGDLPVMGTTAESSFDAGALDYSTTYYWSVTEINEAATPTSYAGPIWSFNTSAYSVVDDFDQYDDNCNRIFFAWEDGLGHNGGEDVEDCDVPASNGNGGGSIVGHSQAPFAERSIVNTGSRQSLPIEYDNAFGPSEATLSLDAQDWTASGIQTLSLMFHGTSGNTGTLYIKVNNSKVLYDLGPTDIARSAWQAWNIDLAGMPGLENVTGLTIGIDGAGAAGMLYIDDIRLYPLPGESITPVEPTTGLLAHYGLNNNAQDDSGHGHHGTPEGDARFANDEQRGDFVTFNGFDALVTVPHADELSFGASDAYSVAAWVYVSNLSNSWTGVVTKSRDATPWYGIWIDGGNNWIFGHDGDNMTGSVAVEGSWTHVAVTYDNGQKRIYLNGLLDSETMSSMDGSGSGDLALGGALGVSEYFEGRIDEVAIYGRSLSGAEVLWLAGIIEPIHKPF